MIKQILQIGVVLSITLTFVGCGSEDSFYINSTNEDSITGNPINEYNATKYNIQYKGLSFYIL